MRIGKAIGWAAAAIAGSIAGAAQAAQPVPWEMGFQPAATPVMEQIEDFHNLLLIITTLVTLVVLVLLLYAVWKFSAKRNPIPTKTTHNTLLEMAWTVVPVIILVVIAVPSFKLLYYEDVIPKADLTVKATGHQWYWSYEYPDNGKIGFDSLVVPDDQLKPGQPRLLAVDNPLVVPVNTTVRVITAAGDVLHSWAVPSFGVKIDAIPGRVNETWFKAERVGTYYGQCSELCGRDHAFMPIVVHVVSEQDYTAWVEQAKKKYASTDGDNARPTAVAAADDAK